MTVNPDVRRPAALVVCGPPASGKSTVGEVLAAGLGAALLDQDTLTGPLTAVVAGLLGTDDLDDPGLSRATRHARYETLTAGAEHNLRAGVPVVLVAPYTAERRDPAAWTALAGRLEQAGGVPSMVWLRLDAATLLSRMRLRAAPRDRPKLADPGYADRVDLAAPAVAHLALDATAPPEAAWARVRERLAGGRGVVGG
ncbi:AAA family ATPase [Streptomyces sp. NPDC047000]|uniref:AAA family ATPase n=1 Tax=Streptomyces sp. NPDC047000 TaxID=3155474 RepID=UPI00340BAED3